MIPGKLYGRGVSASPTSASTSPRKAYWCTYSRKWINIKYYWKLSVTSPEKSALKSMLSTCP